MISVWADVGGTFTDCLVHDEVTRRETKVLSNGLVRVSVIAIEGHQLILEGLPAAEVDHFWHSAKARVLQPDGRTRSLGEVTQQRGQTLSLDAPLAEIPELPITIELDCGLESVVLATRIALLIPLSDSLPPLDVRMGTTRGTNALLTRGGASTALLTTEGFGDVLEIGEQDRPDLFSLEIEKPNPLTNHVVEVAERLTATGDVLIPIDLERLRQSLESLKSQAIESIAICFLHAHVSDEHEKLAEQLARELGFQNVSRSSEVAPLIKLVSRAETTTLDAYLNPILADYLARVWEQFGGPQNCHLKLMTSGGNLVAPAAFRGRDSILSGPAGGVVALGHVAARAGVDAAIGLDMGGTSTDVSRLQGQVGRRYESRVAGVRVLTPMMDIETVAAGGGSICDFVNGRLVVGPQSAGAQPGPACYGRGGPLTVTDVNLLLARIPTKRFAFPLNIAAAEARAEELLAKVRESDLDFRSVQGLAEGFLQIAVTHMAEAVRTVSTAQGRDVREMALVGFGGAAGQHVCRVANELGMRKILDHPDGSVMSALGMGLATIGRVVTQGIYKPLVESVTNLDGVVASLQSEAESQLRQDVGEAEFQFRFECDIRYQGTEAPLTLAFEPAATLETRFHQLHATTFGYSRERAIELVALRCEATCQQERFQQVESPKTTVPSQTAKIWHQDRWIESQLHERSSLADGQLVDAPAMIVSEHSTLLVEPGWRAEMIVDGIIELTVVDPGELAVPESKPQDAVLLEVMARRFQGIADAMGEVLRRTSVSVNVKERRDYSCAVFRSDGALVANAPHVPVHLGAMGHTVRNLMGAFPTMSAGDCCLSNDPFAGGSHLPDVTAVTPVFCGQRTTGKPDFFVASRAHHAEIGGRTPGSMPPDATSLAEEGVVIRKFALVQDGNSNFDQLQDLLANAIYPSRCIEENLADVSAQQAAGAHGAQAIIDLTKQYSVEVVDALMGQLLVVAGDAIQRWIDQLPEGTLRFKDSLDDGSHIAVSLQRIESRLKIEFESADVHPNGFNATPAIVTAAVLYVLRCVSGTNLPLCDGVLRNVDIVIPTGMLNPPAHEDPSKCAAVVAGNVETSQRIVDVLLGALGVAAASQGTMNNVLMGDSTFGYYETIAGGSGATRNSAGADAVHSHMTNTRITDPEILESRLPVRLWRFAVRAGSGGTGKHPGGNGVVREFEFLKPLVVSLITGRRTRAPYGLGTGGPGKCGINRLVTEDSTQELPFADTFPVREGVRLIIETPGGGGCS